MPGNQSGGPLYRGAKREFNQILRHGEQCNEQDPHSTPFVPFASGKGLATGMGGDPDTVDFSTRICYHIAA